MIQLAKGFFFFEPIRCEMNIHGNVHISISLARISGMCLQYECSLNRNSSAGIMFVATAS